MLVDIYLEEGVLVVELIFCWFYVGGKFFNKNYQFFGGLYGVGILVVNVLLKCVEVIVCCDGQVYNIVFENGEKVQDLQVVGICGKCNIGISVYFWLDESFFDSLCFFVFCLMYVLKVKVVLCFGVEIIFKDEVNNSEQCWCYQDGLNDYLGEVVNGLLMLLEKLFIGNFNGEMEVVDWVLLWLLEGGELLMESYVNLILIMQGGIYVNGLC